MLLNMIDRNQTCRNGRVYLHIPMFSKGLLIGKRPFQEGVMCRKNCPFQGTLSSSSEDLLFSSWTSKASCKQNERSSLSRSAIWGTRHPTTGDPLHWWREVDTSSKLPTSRVFFKQETWPCHVCPHATKVYAFGPISADIEDWVVVRGRWWL